MVSRNPPWTAEERDTLIKLWPTKTGTEIGNVLGKSRSAILGMVGRMKLPQKDDPKNKAGRGTPRGERPMLKRFLPRPPPKPVSPPKQRSIEPVPILEALPHHCRAIISSSGAPNGLATVCGGVIPEGSHFSFCAEHLKQFLQRRGSTE